MSRTRTDDQTLPSRRLPSLAPVPLPLSLRDPLLWLEHLLAPQQVVIDLRSTKPHESTLSSDEKVQSGLTDEYELDLARGWLDRLVSLGSRQLAQGVSDEDAETWEALVDKSARVLARSMGSSASGGMQRAFLLPHPERTHDLLTVRLKETTLLSDSTGFRTWGSAPLLARSIASSPFDFFPHPSTRRDEPQPLRILELGSGTGLVGLTLASVLSALSIPAHVDLTDYESGILTNLSHNVELNPEVNDSPVVEISIKRLDWADYLGASVDEADPAGQEDKYDLIFAADVVFEPQHVDLIHATASRLLRRPNSSSTEGGGGTFHLVLPLRSTHTVELETFNRAFSTKIEAKEGGRRLRIERSETVSALKGEDGFGDSSRASAGGRGVEEYRVIRIKWQ